MADSIKSFEQLTVWQLAIELSVDVYKITVKFPSSEQFGMTNQLRRASSSISANIAEGFGRKTQKEKLQFYSISYGSLLETKSFLYLAEKLSFLTNSDLQLLVDKITSLQKQINSLTKAIRDNG